MSITLPEEASLMTMVVTIRFRPAALPGDGADLPVNTWRVRLGALTVGTDALGAATVRLRNHARDTSASGPGCSLIGILKSSILETDALAGVTVLFGVSSRPPHHGCQR